MLKGMGVGMGSGMGMGMGIKMEIGMRMGVGMGMVTWRPEKGEENGRADKWRPICLSFILTFLYENEPQTLHRWK